MISYERQTSFGWLVVIDTFLAGAGGGLFLVGFILNLLKKYESIAEIGVLLGPVMAILGAVFLLAELGSKKRSYRLLSNPSSWIARGAFIMTGFILLGLAYSLPSLIFPEWPISGIGQGIGIVAAVFSILVAIYPGFLFGVVKAIPFWNTSMLPILFLFLSWYTGTAILTVTALFFPTALGITGFHELGGILIALIIMCLIILCGYLEVVRHGSATVKASVQILKQPLFIIGSIILGLLVPLGLLLWSIFVGNLLFLGVLIGISSVLLLFGGLLVRFGIVRAGLYQPLR